MSDKISRILATFFYVGNVPFAPGTAGSLVAVLIYIILYAHPFVYGVLFLACVILGLQASSDVERILKKKDPSCVIIDEVAGMMLALAFLPLKIPVLVTAFVLFRAFDILKIYPINRIEKMPGGEGIMYDDLMAGLYTLIIMQVAIRLV